MLFSLPLWVAIWAEEKVMRQRQMYAVPFDKLTHFPPMSVIASSSPHLNKHKLKLKQKFSWTLQDNTRWAKQSKQSSFPFVCQRKALLTPNPSFLDIRESQNKSSQMSNYIQNLNSDFFVKKSKVTLNKSELIFLM